MEIAIGISQQGRGIEELNNLFIQSNEALRYKVLGSTKMIYFIDEAKRDDSENLNNYEDFEDGLRSSIMMADKNGAARHIEELFTGYKNMENVTEKDFQNNFLQLMSIFIKYSAELKANIFKEYKNSSSLFDLMNNNKTLKEAEAFFKQLAEILCLAVKQKARDAEDYYLESILKYIDENYTKDISLPELSQEVGISLSYIHKIFKTKLDTTYIEYITRKRLEKACEYLESEMKIQDIADMLGFSSSKYFIHVFKKNIAIHLTNTEETRLPTAEIKICKILNIKCKALQQLFVYNRIVCMIGTSLGACPRRATGVPITRALKGGAETAPTITAITDFILTE